MTTCGTCTHWISMEPFRRGEGPVPVEPPDLLDDEDKRQYDADDDNIKAEGHWGWCGLVAELGVKAHDRFYVIDASRYRAQLGTREDFGCVEWTASA